MITIIACLVASLVIKSFEIHPIVTILAEGFLFYTVVDLLNEFWAVYLMWFTGWYIEPVFDSPHLSTSPREFWGKRWNKWVQDFQYKNIFLPLRHAGYHNIIGVICVNLFACSFHEYMIFASHLNHTWTGYMSLFFTIHFGAAMVEVYLSKTRVLGYVPSFLHVRLVKNVLLILFLASTGNLFIRPFFAAWSTTDGFLQGLLRFGIF